MPCKKHSDELDGRSALDCELCDLTDKAEEAEWRKLYEGEKLAGLLPEDLDRALRGTGDEDREG